jgi:hypothetical protein
MAPAMVVTLLPPGEINQQSPVTAELEKRGRELEQRAAEL